MIDHEHNVRLYGISSRGFELAERYHDGAALDHLPDSLQHALGEVARERENLMEHFRETVLQEGGLPKAGNPEREWLETLVDRWYKSLAGAESVVHRLLTADAEWLHEIDAVEAANDWPEPLKQDLAALGAHARQCRQRLLQLVPGAAPEER
ncbi:hypothetical protein [Motiliproteus sp. SC1-56]|uniref:hypothetical protein n=1 Tax=Motiliproteus sp. SC1-56 TaxID=2799565 RepID=UPI001A8F3034|nr:hypothetical protein [Motiliproteus sp. SC1-56]